MFGNQGVFSISFSRIRLFFQVGNVRDKSLNPARRFTKTGQDQNYIYRICARIKDSQPYFFA